jgi:DNA-binding NarL/FixJ family response regulator
MTETLQQFLLDPFAELDLDPRAKEIGRLKIKGMTAREIAEEYGLHKQTVHNWVSRVVKAAGVESARDLSGWAWDKLESMAEDE